MAIVVPKVKAPDAATGKLPETSGWVDKSAHKVKTVFEKYDDWIIAFTFLAGVGSTIYCFAAVSLIAGGISLLATLVACAVLFNIEPSTEEQPEIPIQYFPAPPPPAFKQPDALPTANPVAALDAPPSANPGASPVLAPLTLTAPASLSLPAALPPPSSVPAVPPTSASPSIPAAQPPPASVPAAPALAAPGTAPASAAAQAPNNNEVILATLQSMCDTYDFCISALLQKLKLPEEGIPDFAPLLSDCGGQDPVLQANFLFEKAQAVFLAENFPSLKQYFAGPIPTRISAQDYITACFIDPVDEAKSLKEWLEKNLIDKFDIYLTHDDGSCFFDSVGLGLALVIKNDNMEQQKALLQVLMTSFQTYLANHPKKMVYQKLIAALSQLAENPTSKLDDFMLQNREALKDFLRQLTVQFLLKKVTEEDNNEGYWTAMVAAQRDRTATDAMTDVVTRFVRVLRGGKRPLPVTITTYIQNLAQPTTWAGDLERSVLEEIFKGAVNINMRGYNHPAIPGSDESKNKDMPTIYLLMIPAHFMALVPVNEDRALC